MALQRTFTHLLMQLSNLVRLRSEPGQFRWMLPLRDGRELDVPLWSYAAVMDCFWSPDEIKQHVDAKDVASAMLIGTQVNYTNAAQRAFFARNLNQARANIISSAAFSGQFDILQYFKETLQKLAEEAQKAKAAEANKAKAGGG